MKNRWFFLCKPTVFVLGLFYIAVLLLFLALAKAQEFCYIWSMDWMGIIGFAASVLGIYSFLKNETSLFKKIVSGCELVLDSQQSPFLKNLFVSFNETKMTQSFKIGFDFQ
jgi:hypothetical protein